MTILATTILSNGKGIDLSNALWTVFVGNAVALVGYVLFGYLGDIIGRRETVIGCEILAGIMTAVLLLAAQGAVAVVICYSLVLFFAQGAAAPFFTYVGETYPTRMRGSGAAFVGITGPIGGVVGPLAFAALVGMGLNPVVAGLSGAIAGVLAALVLLGARHVRPRQDLIQIAH